MLEKRGVQIVVGVLAIVAGISAAVAQTPWWENRDSGSSLDDRYFYDNAKARVQWDEGYIEIRAGATADPKKSANLAHARSMALKTARHLAYEKMLETIKGLSLTGSAAYRDELLSNSTLRAKVQGFVQGAWVVREDEKFLRDGSIWVEVTIGQMLRGKRSLSSASSSALEPGPERPLETFAPGDDSYRNLALYSGYSGLVIDARKLGVRPAMFPRIFAPDGRTVYSADGASQEYLLAQGLVGYATSPEKARQQGRVGNNPLVVRARSARGPNHADVVVSEDDAVRIFAADIKSKVLDEARVVFVID